MKPASRQIASSLSSEALLTRWDEALREPSLQDLPYKIELNSWGKLEMSPASNRHGAVAVAAGPHEVWLVSEEGAIRYFGASGEKAKSDFPVSITLPAPMKGNP
jgi:hypothetical protein